MEFAGETVEKTGKWGESTGVRNERPPDGILGRWTTASTTSNRNDVHLFQAPSRGAFFQPALSRSADDARRVTAATCEVRVKLRHGRVREQTVDHRLGVAAFDDIGIGDHSRSVVCAKGQ